MVVLPMKGPMDRVSEEEEDEFDSDTRGLKFSKEVASDAYFY
jgi:hypothetical protein